MAAPAIAEQRDGFALRRVIAQLSAQTEVGNNAGRVVQVLLGIEVA